MCPLDIREIVDHAAAGIVLFSADGLVVETNPAFQRMLGATAAELHGRHYAALGFDATTDGLAVEQQLKRDDGAIVWTMVTWSRMESGIVAVVQDVSDRRKLEEQVRQSQKMEAIGQLAGGVAHDFNNLLTAISANAELMTFELDEAHPAREELEEIRRTVRRGADLTRQLLSFSRKGSAGRPEPLEINDIVREAEKMLRRVIGEHVWLETKLDADVKVVHADRGLIEQVLVNLVVNARDAMPEGGLITIETAHTAAGVTLLVRDTGHGMDDATRLRIFEPFFTTKPEGKGTGLGLAMVYGIVRQARGSIDVASAIGLGTTFTITLPYGEGKSAGVTTVMRIEPMPMGTETVLLVEDEAPVRSSIRRALERQGYTVLDAAHGLDALVAFEQNAGRVDLLLSDVVMPQLGGRPLVERLRRSNPGLPALLMSGYNIDGPVEAPLIQKPFEMTALVQRVRAVLDDQLRKVA
jgi:two-component system, cell cycle sensor histidine kinase and response regulator CckA